MRRRRSSTALATDSMTPGDALRFFDPELALHERGVDLVRVLLDMEYECAPVVVAPDAEDVLFARLNYHRLVPQLRAAVESGRIVAETDRLQRNLESASMRQVVHGLQLESMLVDVGARFNDAGVEFRVLKGTATGHLDHVQPGLRQSADVDLLVRGDSGFRQASQILADSGFVGADLDIRLMDKGETWRLNDHYSIDLHRRLHTVGRPIPEDYWDKWESFTIGGHEFRAFDRGGRMAHAASHLAISYPNHRIMSSLLDLLLIARAADNLERRTATELLQATNVADVVRRITERAAVLCGADRVVVGVRGRHPLDFALRRAYDRPDLDKFDLKLAKTLGMPPRDRLRVLRNWASPSDEFLARGGYSSRWDRLWRVTRRRWGGESATHNEAGNSSEEQ
ncbi:nucleotidyltransferase family protein [Ilumatobacter nonamiensis]|uniref:nucleotidyltransferase family protein n=1 Tax=Ilumatobacter nonamiensis TaxID=467093 RepID=UPI00034918D7|nr:nucleotidyltransferase family protein [Ilumatobacter nonamiensis]